MKKNNKVSIWIGKCLTAADFREYADEQYSEEGELTSTFMKEFKINFYDDQFKELLFKDGDTKKDVFNDFSYSENFMERIPSKNLN